MKDYIKKNLPGENIEDMIRDMSPVVRRAWFIKMKMKERGVSFLSMAKRHRKSAWLLCGAINGRYKWSPSTIRIIETELGIDASPLLLDGEHK